MKSTERTWLDSRGKMIAVPLADGEDLRSRLNHSDRLARFAMRVQVNNYPGAGLYPPSTWMIDPLTGNRGRKLRVRLLNAAGIHGVPNSLYRVRNPNPRS